MAERIVDSTGGAALLGLLEQLVRTGETPPPGQVEPLADSRPDAVASAAELAATLPLGRLTELVVRAADAVGSFWGPTRAVPALAQRSERRPIAEALAARRDIARWSDPPDRRQWWWTDGTWHLDGRLGEGLSQPAVWWTTHPQRAFLTTSPFPDMSTWTTLEDPVFGTWDQCFGPPARWGLTARPDARVYEINGPDDWAQLVRAHPLDTTETHRNTGGWELSEAPGRAEILAIEGQRAARDGWQRFLTPDWDDVATHWDGVHLTWLGYLTTDGTLTDLEPGDITMLRNWGSERTAWLTPVFSDPTPLPIEPRLLADARPAGSDAWAPERQWLEQFACLA